MLTRVIYKSLHTCRLVILHRLGLLRNSGQKPKTRSPWPTLLGY